MDLPIGSEAFKDEPAKVLVDAVGEVHVRHLGDSGYDWDDDEEWSHFLVELVGCYGCVNVVHLAY